MSNAGNVYLDAWATPADWAAPGLQPSWLCRNGDLYMPAAARRLRWFERAARNGLRELQAGRVLTEQELDQALLRRPVDPRKRGS